MLREGGRAPLFCLAHDGAGEMVEEGKELVEKRWSSRARRGYWREERKEHVDASTRRKGQRESESQHGVCRLDRAHGQKRGNSVRKGVGEPLRLVRRRTEAKAIRSFQERSPCPCQSGHYDGKGKDRLHNRARVASRSIECMVSDACERLESGLGVVCRRGGRVWWVARSGVTLAGPTVGFWCSCGREREKERARLMIGQRFR